MDVKEFASLGGKARAAKLTKAQMSAIGKKGVAVREANRKARKAKAKK